MNNPPGGDPGSNDNDSAQKEEIKDFADGANALWSLYGNEAKSHDEARIRTLKDDMDGVLIFVRRKSLVQCTISLECLITIT
jgi:hypothetical protein